jgi:hypothetical protein
MVSGYAFLQGFLDAVLVFAGDLNEAPALGAAQNVKAVPY